MPVTDDSQRLKFAQWILERHLAWIAAAEVKTGVVVAIDTVMVGALATAFSAQQSIERAAWIDLVAFVAGACLASALFCAAMALLPRVDGPKSSKIFFGRIAQNDALDYSQRFQTTLVAEHLVDCLAQIHRNAEIARDKYQWVRKSILWSFLAILPWTIALALLIRK